jgi:RHS repeat-associated protein
MIGTARPASWLPRQGPSASRSASDTRGPISVSPETAVFGRRDRHAAGHALSPSCHRATRPHRPDAHRGHRRFSGHTGGGSYSWARYYSPGLGRFLSEDPLEFEAGDDNLYAYVFNDPVNETDPTGEIPAVVIRALVGCVAGGGVSIITDTLSGRKVDWGDAAIGCFVGGLGGSGFELRLGPNLRLAPFGNRVGDNWWNHLPHYHRRFPGPGGGIGRHRPWQPPPPGGPWWNRF